MLGIIERLAAVTSITEPHYPQQETNLRVASCIHRATLSTKTPFKARALVVTPSLWAVWRQSVFLNRHHRYSYLPPSRANLYRVFFSYSIRIVTTSRKSGSRS